MRCIEIDEKYNRDVIVPGLTLTWDVLKSARTKKPYTNRSINTNMRCIEISWNPVGIKCVSD